MEDVNKPNDDATDGARQAAELEKAQEQAGTKKAKRVKLVGDPQQVQLLSRQKTEDGVVRTISGMETSAGTVVIVREDDLLSTVFVPDVKVCLDKNGGAKLA